MICSGDVDELMYVLGEVGRLLRHRYITDNGQFHMHISMHICVYGVYVCMYA